MSYHICPDRRQSYDAVQQGFLQADGLPFSEALTADEIQRVFDEEGVAFGDQPDDVYTPALTLWAFLSQAIHSGVQRSCNAAVERVRTLCLALGLRAPSPDSGAYYRARAKLPESALRRLTYKVADALEEAAPEAWLRWGRHVKMVDGSTLTMPDTEQNQAEWPQLASQQLGLGFPILRFVLLSSLATGAVCGFAEAPYEGKETGEPALLRALLDRLNPSDILLGDSCYCSYFMIALLQERGVDVIFPQHQRRKTDYAKGKRLGEQDHVVTWEKPVRPDWMDQETYERMPDKLTVRELTVTITTPNSRASELILVTTLASPKKYPKSEVGDLYGERWNVEVDIRSNKVTMNLEDLRGQFPDMVRKELWVHCLAYNLIRRTMAAAAVVHEQTPRTVSFAGALQSVSGMMTYASILAPSALTAFATQKLASIASHRVGNRPYRVEPRAVKRRPKIQQLLTRPREEARAMLRDDPAATL